MMPVDSLGFGEVWSDPEKPIVHFGSPPKRKTALVDEHGKPIE